MKLVSLVSSGIDSPVATYLFSKKVDEIILIHGDNRPFTDDQEIKNFINLAKHLKKNASSIKQAYIIPYGENLGLYKQNCHPRYTCVFCKRMLLRLAEALANKKKAEAIIMGDSLGQVASQTLQNIRTIDEVVGLPIFRPLIGLDKEEIIQIAKEIGTYNLSIVKSSGCTAVPSKPATQAKLEDIIYEEQKINIKEQINKAIEKAELIKL